MCSTDATLSRMETTVYYKRALQDELSGRLSIALDLPIMRLSMSAPTTPHAGHSRDIVGFCWGFDAASNPEFEVRDGVDLTS